MSIESPTTEPKAGASPARLPLLPFALLTLALLWSLAIRVPLILNADVHLDGDLAVDGLTLHELTQGVWRWHFPGTPHIGSAPLFFALPQALILGADARTLVSGGAVVQMLVMIACFALSWRCDGSRAACWSLLPLTFASTGLVWLSGRITGGHLLSVAMLSGICLGAKLALERPSQLRYLLLGLWCGIALWIDSMSILGIAALLVVIPFGSWLGAERGMRFRTAWLAARFLPALILGTAIGLVPKFVGDAVDPYDAYNEQMSPIFDREVLWYHAKLLVKDCLPRLVAGHRIPTLVSDPPMNAIPTSLLSIGRDRAGFFDEISAHLSIVLFLGAMISLGLGGGSASSVAVRVGLGLTSLAVVAAFVLNRNIYNADNYRYLVFLIVPWSLGFGRAFDLLSSKGTGGAVGAGLLGLAFAVVMTCDVGFWYERFGWLRDGRPIVAKVDNPVLDWLEAHPEVDGLVGSYWDVYKIAFQTKGRVKVIPYGRYPNRYPEWKKLWPSQRPQYLLTGTQRDGGGSVRTNAMADGGVEIARFGAGVIHTWPEPRAAKP